MRTVLCLATCLMLALVLPGCSTEQLALAEKRLEQTQTTLAATQRTLDQLEQQAVATREQAATQPAGPEQTRLVEAAARIEAVIAQAKPIVTAAQAAASGAAREIAQASDATDAVLGTVQAAADVGAPFIPVWGGIVGLLVTNVITLIRNYRNRAAARAIPRSIELVQGADGKVDFDDPTTQDNLRAMQGATAARIVDEAQGKRLALPF